MSKKTTVRVASRLIGYCRVSTEEQAREGVSMDAQAERLKAYCIAQGAELVRIEADNGTSGSVAPMRRPAMARALGSIRAGEADGLVSLKLDRLSRSTRDVLDLADDANRNGWRLVSVAESLDTASATGRFTLTILAALAQLEREQVGERTRLALEHVARQGRARSRFVPFGYRTAEGGVEQRKGCRKRLVEHADEQYVIDRIERLRAEGLGARRIAHALNSESVDNPRRPGAAWNPSTVAGLLRTLQRREGLGLEAR